MTTWGLVLLPLAAAAGTIALRRHERAAPLIVLTTTAVVLGLGIRAALTAPTSTWRWGGELALELAIGGFGRVMVVLVPAVALPVLAFAAATEHEGRARLLALMVAFVGAMQLLVLAADLLTLLFAWELVGATSWALIGHGWRDPANGRSAAQAFVTTRIGDVGLYLAAGFTFASTGSFHLSSIAQVEGAAIHVIAAGVLLAAAAKSAQLPFAPWLFSAMAGPTPVSALLHSATLVSAGAYLLIRVAPVLEPAGWFRPTVAGLGLATALAAGVVAVTQTHIKRVLAGSTSAQYGLMFVAVGAGSTAAAGAQLVTHAVFKALLFVAAGIAIHAARAHHLEHMRLGHAMPWAAGLAGVGALGLAAVPPLGAGWTKEQILAAALAGSPWLGAGTLLAAALTAAYAARLWFLAFGREHPELERSEPIVPPGRVEVGALALLAAGTVALGLLWLPGSYGVVEGLTEGTLSHGTVVDLVSGLVAIALGAFVATVLHRNDRLLDLALPERVRSFAASWFGLPELARVAVVDPVLRLSSLLAIRGDRAIDTVIHAAAGFALAVAVALARVGETLFDRTFEAVGEAVGWLAGVVHRHVERGVHAATAGVGAGTDLLARTARRVDDRGVDGGVEGLARATGGLARRSQRAQTGLAHHYVLYAGIGLLLFVLVLAVYR